MRGPKLRGHSYQEVKPNEVYKEAMFLRKLMIDIALIRDNTHYKIKALFSTVLKGQRYMLLIESVNNLRALVKHNSDTHTRQGLKRAVTFFSGMKLLMSEAF
ncbi:hypothetical protein AB5N19_00228 [Seiridium cardinale]